MATEAGRELNYRHWDKAGLVRALMQAEDDIKDLKADLENLQDERDQYLEESRESAKILGGILRVMADNDMFLSGLGPLIREGQLPDVAPALEAAARRPRRFIQDDAPAPRRRGNLLVTEHRSVGSNGIFDLCACGAQWLVQADRCVTQPVKP